MTSLITLITIALLLIFWVGTTHALRKSNKGIQLSKKEVYLTWIAGIARALLKNYLNRGWISALTFSKTPMTPPMVATSFSAFHAVLSILRSGFGLSNWLLMVSISA